MENSLVVVAVGMKSLLTAVLSLMTAIAVTTSCVCLCSVSRHDCPVCDNVFYTKHGVDVHSRSVHNLRNSTAGSAQTNLHVNPIYSNITSLFMKLI